MWHHPETSNSRTPLSSLERGEYFAGAQWKSYKEREAIAAWGGVLKGEKQEEIFPLLSFHLPSPAVASCWPKAFQARERRTPGSMFCDSKTLAVGNTWKITSRISERFVTSISTKVLTEFTGYCFFSFFFFLAKNSKHSFLCYFPFSFCHILVVKKTIFRKAKYINSFFLECISIFKNKFQSTSVV